MNPLDFLPAFMRNEVVLFGVIAVAFALFYLLGNWLIREIRGRPEPANTHGETVTAAGDPPPDEYRGATGATRTMDSSPAGILGSIARTPTNRPPISISTSLISGSDVSAGLSTDRDRQQIEPELRQAGYYRPSALAEYKSVRAMLVLFPLIAAAAFSLLEPASFTAIFVAGVVLAGLGYSIPRVYVNYVARSRKREIERGLPTALDMIVLGLVAGQNIMNSFQRVAFEIRRAFPILSEEMQIAYRQAELNTLGHALRVWSDRCGVREVYNLSVILVQSERQGADVSNSLLEFASSYRVTLRQRADGQANRASFWMLFPTIFCMWIPAAVVLAAPVYFQYVEGRAKAREAMMPPGGSKNEALDKTFRPYLQGSNNK